jgi:hypothetical protein
MHCTAYRGIIHRPEARTDDIAVVLTQLNIYLGLAFYGKTCSTNGRDEECIQDIGGKARRKETTGKTKA